MSTLFELQGHRGARGLAPENTLPSFEMAFDLGVTSVETDVHLTADGIPVLLHDPNLNSGPYRKADGVEVASSTFLPVIAVSLAELRGYKAVSNPDRRDFPDWQASAPLLAKWFGEKNELDPFTPPTLIELFAFAADYAGDPGTAVGKTSQQRARAARIRFDLELKRVPFYPMLMGDDFDGEQPGLVEKEVVAAIQAAGVASRTTVRSFDHRSVRAVRQLEPQVTGAILVGNTAPVSPANLARQADAAIYCPNFEFLDKGLVALAHENGIRVLPWTVNEPRHWERLLKWKVDGITTDFPDRLAAWLRERGIAWNEAEGEGAEVLDWRLGDLERSSEATITVEELRRLREAMK